MARSPEQSTSLVDRSDGPSRTTLWRVFPYDPDAAPGAPFSAAMVPRGQGSGRFDVPDLSPVWYFAESPVHAVAEVVQSLRGQTLDAADLVRAGHRLAVVPATLPADVAARVVDLCEPAALARWAVRPDHLASRDPAVTQRIARALAEAGAPGFRWWSALAGDWHATVLFDTHLTAGALAFGAPRALAPGDAAVRAACEALGIALAPAVGRGRR